MRESLSGGRRRYADLRKQKRSPSRRFGQEHFRGSVECYTARRVAFFVRLCYCLGKPALSPLTNRPGAFTMKGALQLRARVAEVANRALPSDGPRKGEP